jgi:hypothetical protein
MLDSPRQGSKTGLTPPISTSVPSTPAGASPSGLGLPDDRRGHKPGRLRPQHYLPRRHIHHPLTRGGPTNGVRSGLGACPCNPESGRSGGTATHFRPSGDSKMGCRSRMGPIRVVVLPPKHY